MKQDESIDISIVIVSYNVRTFLSLCLLSIERNIHDLSIEIIVVDNDSNDDTIAWLKSHWPTVKVIANKRNRGFAAACNQGASETKGRHILFLNPDTILSGEALKKCSNHIEMLPDTGAIGGYLLDGSGRYLPETARNVPGWKNAVAKLLGLSGRSSFGKGYYARIRDTDNCQVEILPGAFLFIAKDAYWQAGGMDERFFMYGEDIDLCYRLLQSEKTNWVLPDVKVVHFKGESTKKYSFSYNRHFYRAMHLFVNKHLPPKQSLGHLWRHLIFIGLIIGQFLLSALLASTRIIADAVMVAVAFITGHYLWGQIHFGTFSYYLHPSILYTGLGYLITWLFFFWINGYYFEERRTYYSVVKGWFNGLIGVLVFYALLPETLRFSRMSLFLSAVVLLLMLLAFHWLNRWIKQNSSPKGFTLIGGSDETEPPFSLRDLIRDQPLDTVNTPREVLEKGHHNALIFDLRSVDMDEAISFMADQKHNFTYLFLDRQLGLLVDSRHASQPGRALTLHDRYQIVHPEYQLQKRIYDLSFAFLLMVLSPVLVIIYGGKSPWKALISILKGKYTFISYEGRIEDGHLPSIKPGYMLPSSRNERDENREVILEKARIYALHYSVIKDIFACTRYLPQLLNALIEEHERENKKFS